MSILNTSTTTTATATATATATTTILLLYYYYTTTILLLYYYYTTTTTTTTTTMNIYFSNHVQDERVIYNKKPGQIYYNILRFLHKNDININIERRKHILAVEI